MIEFLIEVLIGIAVVIGGVFMCVAVWLGLRMTWVEPPPSKEFYDKQIRLQQKESNNVRGSPGQIQTINEGDRYHEL